MTTQEILIGTNDGIIFEAMLSNPTDILYSSSNTVIWKEVRVAFGSLLILHCDPNENLFLLIPLFGNFSFSIILLFSSTFKHMLCLK